MAMSAAMRLLQQGSKPPLHDFEAERFVNIHADLYVVEIESRKFWNLTG